MRCRKSSAGALVSPLLSSLSVSGTPWNAITEFSYLLLSENREGLGEKRKRKGAAGSQGGEKEGEKECVWRPPRST